MFYFTSDQTSYVTPLEYKSSRMQQHSTPLLKFCTVSVVLDGTICDIISDGGGGLYRN